MDSEHVLEAGQERGSNRLQDFFPFSPVRVTSKTMHGALLALLALCLARGALPFVMAPPALGYRVSALGTRTYPRCQCHGSSIIGMTVPSAELISAGSQSVDGVEVDMKLENLGGSRRRICAGIKIDVSLAEGIPYRMFGTFWAIL